MSTAAFAISQEMEPNFFGCAPEKQYLQPRPQSLVARKQIVESSTSPFGTGFTLCVSCGLMCQVSKLRFMSSDRYDS